MPINIISNIINGEDNVLVFDEIANKEDFEKSDTGKKTYEGMEELKYP